MYVSTQISIIIIIIIIIIVVVVVVVIIIISSSCIYFYEYYSNVHLINNKVFNSTFTVTVVSGRSLSICRPLLRASIFSINVSIVGRSVPWKQLSSPWSISK